MSFHQGAKVPSRLPPAPPPRIEIARKAGDDSEWLIKQEAHRLALSNKNKPWARRWLKENNRRY